MAKNKPKNQEDPSSPAEAKTQPEVPAFRERLRAQRILVSDTSNPTDPVAFILSVPARDKDDASARVTDLGPDFDLLKGALPPGMARVACRYEEIAEIFRDKFPIRRRVWPQEHCVALHLHTVRVDRYMRNPLHPTSEVQYLDPYQIEAQDLLADDWEVCPKPPRWVKAA